MHSPCKVIKKANRQAIEQTANKTRSIPIHSTNPNLISKKQATKNALLLFLLVRLLVEGRKGPKIGGRLDYLCIYVATAWCSQAVPKEEKGDRYTPLY